MVFGKAALKACIKTCFLAFKYLVSISNIVSGHIFCGFNSTIEKEYNQR